MGCNIYKDITEFSISRATLLEENARKSGTVIDIDLIFFSNSRKSI